MKALSLPSLFLNILGIIPSNVRSSPPSPHSRAVNFAPNTPFIQPPFLLSSSLGCLEKVETFVMILLIRDGIAYVPLKTCIEMAC